MADPDRSRWQVALRFGAAASLALLAACGEPELEGDLSLADALPALSAPVREKLLAGAERALAEGRPAEVKQIVERILISEPDHPEALLLLAESILASGQAPAAVNAFDKAARHESVRPRALQGRGISLILIGDSETGAASLHEALAADPGLWRAWSALGTWYDRRTDWGKAEDAYTRAIDVNPGSAMVFNNRGYHHLLRRRMHAAMADFSRALELDPGFEPAEVNLRIALAWNGQYEQAVSGVAAEHLPKALNNAGYVAALRGDLENAESLLLRSVEADYGFNKTARRNLTYIDALKTKTPVAALMAGMDLPGRPALATGNGVAPGLAGTGGSLDLSSLEPPVTSGGIGTDNMPGAGLDHQAPATTRLPLANAGLTEPGAAPAGNMSAGQEELSIELP